MGLLSGLKKAVQKRKETRAEKKTGRQTARKEKVNAKRQFKLDKIKTRQDARTQRASVRGEAKVAKAHEQSLSDIAAYENGMQPADTDLESIVGTVGDVVGSIFGKKQTPLEMGYDGDMDGMPDYAPGTLAPSIGVQGMFSNPMVIIAAAIAAIFLLPKLMKRGR